MIAKRLLLAAIATPSFAVHAETITVGPDLCPALAMMTIIARGNIEAVDLNAGRRVADGVVIFYDRRLEGWASRRLFARFMLAPETGLPQEYDPKYDRGSICDDVL